VAAWTGGPADFSSVRSRTGRRGSLPRHCTGSTWRQYSCCARRPAACSLRVVCANSSSWVVSSKLRREDDGRSLWTSRARDGSGDSEAGSASQCAGSWVRPRYPPAPGLPLFPCSAQPRRESSVAAASARRWVAGAAGRQGWIWRVLARCASHASVWGCTCAGAALLMTSNGSLISCAGAPGTQCGHRVRMTPLAARTCRWHHALPPPGLHRRRFGPAMCACPLFNWRVLCRSRARGVVAGSEDMTASVVSNAWATYEKGATQQVPVSLDCVPPHVCARAASSHGTQRGGGATVTHARAHTHAHARTHARTRSSCRT